MREDRVEEDDDVPVLEDVTVRVAVAVAVAVSDDFALTVGH